MKKKEKKEKKNRIEKIVEGTSKSITKLANKTKLRKVLKGQKHSVVVQQGEPYSILADPNRFFKNKYEEDKRQFFFK